MCFYKKKWISFLCKILVFEASQIKIKLSYFLSSLLLTTRRINFDAETNLNCVFYDDYFLIFTSSRKGGGVSSFYDMLSPICDIKISIVLLSRFRQILRYRYFLLDLDILKSSQSINKDFSHRLVRSSVCHFVIKIIKERS